MAGFKPFSEKTAPRARLLEEVVTVASLGAVATYLGLELAAVNQLLLPALQVAAVYPFFFRHVRGGRLWVAALTVLVWAVSVSLPVIAASYNSRGWASARVINGESYVKEMFEWIATGRGAEGDISLFLIPKLREVALFAAATAASAGLLGLLMGAILLNYMNYYVGVLLAHAKPGYLLQVALLSWQVYAVLRVVGYVFLGVALSRIAVLAFSQRRLVVEDEARRLLLYALVLIALDFVLKATVANSVYQPLLKEFTG